MLTMDHKLVLEILVQLLFMHCEYNYLFEGCKLFEYETETDLLNIPKT